MLLIGVSILTGYSFISAQTWTNAPTVPPTNNTYAPVNVGSTAQDKNGTFAANKLGVISNSPVLELIDADAGQKDWRLGVEGGNSFVIRADRTNDLDAGETTITWSDDGNHQMVLYNGADESGDYAQFSNQVRAAGYCDLNGENCLDDSMVSGIFHVENQYIETSLGGSDTSDTKLLGNWTFCALGRQKTTADDDNNYDGCHVYQSQPGYWALAISKAGEDSLTCGAQCFYLGESRDTSVVDPHSYVWTVGSWGTAYPGCTSGADGYYNATKHRTVSCTRDDGVRVPDYHCTTTKPDTTLTVRIFCQSHR